MKTSCKSANHLLASLSAGALSHFERADRLTCRPLLCLSGWGGWVCLCVCACAGLRRNIYYLAQAELFKAPWAQSWWRRPKRSLCSQSTVCVPLDHGLHLSCFELLILRYSMSSWTWKQNSMSSNCIICMWASSASKLRC